MNNNIENNPFCKKYNTPHDAIPYDSIELEHFIPAIKEGIRQEEECINAICANNDTPNFENTIEPFERAGGMLGDVIRAFEALINSHSNDAIVAVSEEINKLHTEHSNNITLNEKLFERIKYVYENKDEHRQLRKEQIRLLDDIYTMFVRSGANLKDKERDEYRSLCQKLSMLSLKFQENIIKDTDAYTLHITNKKDLEGLPSDLIETAASTAADEGKKGWIFTLHRPCYIPFITFCKNRELRKQMYMEYSTLGAKGNSYDNRNIVIESVNTRLRLANLLGYDTYSDYVLAERMANLALRQGRNVTLEPMNPYERRIIHTAVQNIKGVTSWSVGEEPNRRVVIGSGKDKGGYNRGGQRGRGGRRPTPAQNTTPAVDREQKKDFGSAPLYGKIERKIPEAE